MKAILQKIPKQSGIYKFYDANENIIYIGKSVNLFSRVNSYFNGLKTLNFAKQKMVKQIVNIETIVVENERESLILETTLIKKHLPKYNILMKDGKSHIYIKITNQEYPKIIKTRLKNKNGIYFGPYISTFQVNNILKLIKKHFGYGCGGEHFFHDGKNYNLDKYLFSGNTLNTLGEINHKKQYQDQVDLIKNFLKGNFRDVIKDWENKMKILAKELKFEEASKIKQMIDSVISLEITQNMKDSIPGDYNFIHCLEKFENTYVGIIKLRDGKIVDFNTYQVENKLSEEVSVVVKTFIENLSTEEESNIAYILPFDLEISNTIETQVAKIGPKHDILKMCYKNIYEYAYKKHLDSLSTKGFGKSTMKNLLKILGYNPLHKDIIFECNDISHISGNHTVASRSIIENGKSNTSKYKKFRIKTLESQKIDDFGSMREIITRRVAEIEKSKYVPDLIIIDGGKGQLSSVVQVIEDFKAQGSSEIQELLSNLQIVSIAKREEELFTLHNGKFERFLLDKDANELRLVQKIRDESHRFAITFNRDSRNKAMKKNILESLPGFGPVSRKKLIQNIGSMEKIAQASESELLQHINIAQLEILRDHGLVE